MGLEGVAKSRYFCFKSVWSQFGQKSTGKSRGTWGGLEGVALKEWP